MGEASNKIIGKLKVGSDTLATLEGHWDQEIYIRDRATGVGDDWEGGWGVRWGLSEKSSRKVRLHFSNTSYSDAFRLFVLFIFWQILCKKIHDCVA